MSGYTIQHDPPPPDPPRPPPTIRIKAGILHTLADQAQSALIAAKTEIFQRGKLLVRPALTEMPAADIWVNGVRMHDRKTMAAVLDGLQKDGLVDELSKAARWEKFNEKKGGHVQADPPDKVAALLLSRFGRWEFPSVCGIICTPTLRPDGTLITRRGFDVASGYYLALPPDFYMPAISDCPSRSEAEAALKELEDLLVEFPFVDDVSRSVTLSGLITPVVRSAMSVAPLHGITGPQIGTGKSFAVDLFAAVATGRQCPVAFVGESIEELDKKLNGLLLAGVSMVSIDNVRCQLDSDLLCQACERPLLSLRKLGRSDPFLVSNSVCPYATGNNLTVAGEMVRRTLLSALDANVERPELRSFKGNPIAAVMADRGRYVAAILTIIRAHIAAGRPRKQAPLGSFPAWSAFVRDPLVWLGKDDPVVSQDTIRKTDPVGEVLAEVMRGWEAVIGLNVAMTTTGLKGLVASGIDRTLHDTDDALAGAARAWT
jgi:putative DNA primase/helicase